MNGDFENFKEQVRSTADMVEIISGYVPLKKKGQNSWGCCPFHGEKTPSFSVKRITGLEYSSINFAATMPIIPDFQLSS